MLPTIDSFWQDTHSFHMEEWEIVSNANRNQREQGQLILISDKIDFKAESIIKYRILL